MHLCDYCGAPAPYSCDAIDPEKRAICGRLVCDKHARSMYADRKNKGRATLCQDHEHLQKPHDVTPRDAQAPDPLRPAPVTADFPDPAVKFVPLVIDGREYKLAWSWWAIAKAEQACPGTNLMQGIAAFLLNTANVTQHIAMLYAAMSLAQPAMTPEQVAQLFSFDVLPDIRIALIEAYNASVPEKKRLTAVIEDEAEADAATAMPN